MPMTTHNEHRCGKCGEELPGGGDSQRRALWELLKTAVREYRVWRRRARVVNTERARANGERDAARRELARLREHTIQLPEDWRQQVSNAIAQGQIIETVESWRPAAYAASNQIGKVAP